MKIVLDIRTVEVRTLKGVVLSSVSVARSETMNHVLMATNYEADQLIKSGSVMLDKEEHRLTVVFDTANQLPLEMDNSITFSNCTLVSVVSIPGIMECLDKEEIPQVPDEHGAIPCLNCYTMCHFTFEVCPCCGKDPFFKY